MIKLHLKATDILKINAIFNYFGFDSQILKIREEFFEMMTELHRLNYLTKTKQPKHEIDECKMRLISEVADYKILCLQLDQAELNDLQKSEVKKVKNHFHEVVAPHRNDIIELLEQDTMYYPMAFSIKLSRTINLYKINWR